MRGMLAFLKKEFVEIVRTWRIWVLPGILLFFAITTPIMTKVTPDILESFSKSQPGAIIQLPDPTYKESYAESISNLSEIFALAVLIAFAGTVNGERKSGTSILVLTKPVSRAAFVIAKAISQVVLLAGTLAVGTLVTWAGTLIVFGEAPLEPIIAATAVWLAFGVLLTAVATLLSVLLESPVGSAMLGVPVFFVIAATSIWPPAREYGPAGLLSAAGNLAVGKPAEYGWPLAVALAASVVLVAFAALVFRGQEL